MRFLTSVISRGNSMLMSELAGLATKTLSHEAAQRKPLWGFVPWCLSGEILLNTLLLHYLFLELLFGKHRFVAGLIEPDDRRKFRAGGIGLPQLHHSHALLESSGWDL